MFYDILYKCPTCGSGQTVSYHYQLDAHDYDGNPLTDFLYEDGIKEMMAKLALCPGNRNCPVEASGFYMKIVKPPSPLGRAE